MSKKLMWEFRERLKANAKRQRRIWCGACEAGIFPGETRRVWWNDIRLCSLEYPLKRHSFGPEKTTHEKHDLI